jgi:hypothetical protein
VTVERPLIYLSPSFLLTEVNQAATPSHRWWHRAPALLEQEASLEPPGQVVQRGIPGIGAEVGEIFL